MKRWKLMVGVCVLGCAAPLWADQVTLSNGDRLTGTIESMTEGTLKLTATLTGDASIAVTDIVTLATDDAVEVHLLNGSVLKTVLTAGEAGAVTVRGGQQVMLADIASINPPVPAPPRWKGALSLGWTRTQGNTHNETYSASANASKRREMDRTTLNFDLAQTTSDGTKTEDWWRAKGKYDYFFSHRCYGYGEVRYETDSIANLDQRIIAGLGAGYQWIETDAMNLGTEIGVASRTEKYQGTSSSTELSMQAGYNFDWQITDTVFFIHDLTYYPTVSDFADYYLTSTAELRANLTKTMFGSFKTIFNFDATPAAGKGKTDVKYILGVGLTF